MPVPERLPSYKELLTREGAPPGSAWGLFGADDQVGCVNLMTPEKAVEAARLVRTGKSFALNWEFELPNPALFRRGNLRHTITGQGAGRDDIIDNFYPQASSQWDGLTHVGHPQYGFYNGVTADQITGREGTRNGIEHWARRGMVTRGVLLDMARYLASQGTPVAGNEARRFSVDELEAARKAQGVEIRQGDVLLVRSGWMEWYLNASPQERFGITNVQNLRAPGIASTEDMAEYLWDLHVAAVAGDHPSLEAWPPTPETGGFLHQRLIGLLGIPIGELWYLEALAADCAADGVYEFMFTSAPLNILGGVGSPPNAIAIK
jgi:kynurenine formamidase